MSDNDDRLIDEIVAQLIIPPGKLVELNPTILELIE